MSEREENAMSADICDPAATDANADANGIRQHTEFEFEEVATTVEERFRRAYHAVGQSDDYEEISTGWWLVIKRMGLGIWIGKDKPAIQSGDLLSPHHP